MKSMLPPTLFTKRLILAPIGNHPTDATDLRKHRNAYSEDEKINTGFRRDAYWDEEDAQLIVEAGKATNRDGCCCHWSIRLKNSPGELIGSICYSTMEFPGVFNRGFWLASEHQGQGIMSEAVVETLNYLFSCRMQRMVSEHYVTNPASRRIKEKTGAVLVDCYLRPDTANQLSHRTELWELTREQWRRQPECHLRPSLYFALLGKWQRLAATAQRHAEAAAIVMRQFKNIIHSQLPQSSRG